MTRNTKKNICADKYRTCWAENLVDHVGKHVVISGRILSVRNHSKTVFSDFIDESGGLQVALLASNKHFLDYSSHLVAGNIVTVSGVVKLTKSGEPTVFISKSELHSVCDEQLSPLSNPNLRFTNRTKDLLTNKSANALIRCRSAVLESIRNTMSTHFFLESDTPILQAQYSGGKAQPFVTQSNLSNEPLYLKGTSELYLKQLVSGGMERVYEIQKCFRNEGISSVHSPEFLMLEAYCAYAELEEMIELVKDIMSNAKESIPDVHLESLQINPIEFDNWTVITYQDACDELLKIRWDDCNDLKKVLMNIEASTIDIHYSGEDVGTIHMKIIQKHLADKFQSHTILKYLPASTSPLVRARSNKPSELERAWVFVRGLFVCDIASELTNAEEQLSRLKQQAPILKEAHSYNNSNSRYLQAIKIGLPPLGGIGIGIERFLMALLGENHIREVIPFPFEFEQSRLCDSVKIHR